MAVLKAVPYLDKMHIRVHEEGDNDKDSHQQQQQTENGINLAYQFVDGYQRGNQIIGKDNHRPYPYLPARSELIDKQLRRRLHKHGPDKNHQEDREIAHHLLGAVAKEGTVQLGQRAAVVTHRHKTGDKVVHSTGKDTTEDNPKERCSAELRAHNGTTDRTNTCNVEELDEENAPRLHRDIVNAILHSHCWGKPAWIDCNAVAQPLGINEISKQKQNN